MLVFVLASCKIIEHTGSTKHVYIHDSITTVDTTYIPVHIVDHSIIDSVNDLFAYAMQAYDSLQNEDAKKASLLKALGAQIIAGYNSDTTTVCSDYACAHGALVNSKLALWLEQFPIDTNVMMLNYSTYVKTLHMLDEQQKETVIIKKKFYEDPWFYTTLILLIIIGATCYVKLVTKRLI